MEVCATSTRCHGGCIITHTGVMCKGLNGSTGLDRTGAGLSGGSPCDHVAPVTGGMIDCTTRTNLGVDTFFGKGEGIPIVCPFTHCRCCGPRRGKRTDRVVRGHYRMDV